MKRTAIAAVWVLAANAAVLLGVAWEQGAPASLATVAVCGSDLTGGGSSEEPPALLLRVTGDAAPPPPGLDAAGLHALGFSDRVIAAIGQVPDSTFRWPRQRPAWVQLRQTSDAAKRFDVVAVAARRDLLVPDSTSIVVRGRVGIPVRYRPSPADSGRGVGAPPTRGLGVLVPAIVEIMPAALHLSRTQNATLRRTTSGGLCETGPWGSVVVASGARGGIWVESVR